VRKVATAIKLARELEPYDIAWFEEPVSPDDHAGQAKVRRSTTFLLPRGEREFTRFDFQDLLERREWCRSPLRRLAQGTGTPSGGQHYREIASKLREIARECRFPGARREILDLASRLERRADDLDGRSGLAGSGRTIN
jgi:hypothetical protein